MGGRPVRHGQPPRSLGHVETAIFDFLLSTELHFDAIHQGQSVGKRRGVPSANDPGCVKTPTMNFRVERLSRLR
jgi:hypothetical protein